MEISYKLWCMNHVVYAGNYKNSRMVNEYIERLCFQNNMRYFKSYDDYKIMEKIVDKCSGTKVIFYLQSTSWRKSAGECYDKVQNTSNISNKF